MTALIVCEATDRWHVFVYDTDGRLVYRYVGAPNFGRALESLDSTKLPVAIEWHNGRRYLWGARR